MNTLTDYELSYVTGGNAFITWGEQAASDGLAAMDSGNITKSAIGTILASAGGWVYLAGLTWEMF